MNINIFYIHMNITPIWICATDVVFCAKKRVEHACICPRMDTGSQFWSHAPPPPPNWLFRGQKNGNCKFPIENRCFRSKISGQNGIFSAKILSRRFRLSRTTSDPSRLIRQRPIDCDRGRHRQMKTDGFLPIFSFQHRQKVSSADLHPQKKPTAKVLWPGGHYSCDKRCGLLW